MDASSTYSAISLWVIAAVFFLGLLIAREIGWWIRNWRKRSAESSDHENQDAFAMTSVLGLLALLIGFTFSISLSRYETRRDLVVKEANAIGTTWLRTQLLDEPDRTRMQDLLRRYVDARLAFGSARSTTEEMSQYRRTEGLQNELWTTLVACVAPFRDSPRASLLLTTTNDSIDLAAERFAARQSHIPLRILRMLLMFAWLGAGLVGYEKGHQRKTTTLLFLLFTLAATLVVDLDRPATGWIGVPQTPMIDLRASMDA